MIPDFQTVMLPLLKWCAQGAEVSLGEVTDYLEDHFKLSDEDKRNMLPSGRQQTFRNRVGWAKTYLAKSGALESTRRGYFRITDRGRSILKNPPERITIQYLEQYEEFRTFRDLQQSNLKNRRDDSVREEQPEEVKTPEELLEGAYQKLKDELADDLLTIIKKCSPTFFESLVIDLLVSMGYGGSKKEAGQAVGKAGDGGIDGIIKEDKLGLDAIYIQAKRWEGVVGRPEIQKFAGALQGQRARKGIFITTSAFTKDALEFARNIDSKIILIDGEELTSLMIENNVGVAVQNRYEIKKIDNDYFEE